MKLILAFLVAAIVPSISGIVVEDGACPDVESVPNFNLEKFSGLWYVTNSIPLDHAIHMKCTTEKFTLREDGKIDGIFSFIDIHTNKTGNLTYVMKLATDKKVGDLVISSSKDTESFDYPLKVIATDYENYLVFWCCHVKDNKSYRVAIIESRSPTIPEDALKKAYAVLDKNKLDRSQMQQIVQTDCEN